MLADGWYEWLQLGEPQERAAGPVPLHGRRGRAVRVRRAVRPGPSSARTSSPSATILTTRANEVCAPVHDRMPVVLGGPRRGGRVARRAPTTPSCSRRWPAVRTTAAPANPAVNKAGVEGAGAARRARGLSCRAMLEPALHRPHRCSRCCRRRAGERRRSSPARAWRAPSSASASSDVIEVLGYPGPDVRRRGDFAGSSSRDLLRTTKQGARRSDFWRGPGECLVAGLDPSPQAARSAPNEGVGKGTMRKTLRGEAPRARSAATFRARQDSIRICRHRHADAVQAVTEFRIDSKGRVSNVSVGIVID